MLARRAPAEIGAVEGQHGRVVLGHDVGQRRALRRVGDRRAPSAAAIAASSHGLPCAPRPIITPSAPLAASAARAVAMSTISPFTTTGTPTASLTARTAAQSARPR